MAYRLKEKKKLHLEIENAQFDLTVNTELLERVRKTGMRMQGYGKDPESENDSAEQQMDFMCDCIDDILGDGAADRIFTGTDADMLDAADVYVYIVQQIEQALKNRKQQRTAANQHPTHSGKRRRYQGHHK